MICSATLRALEEINVAIITFKVHLLIQTRTVRDESVGRFIPPLHNAFYLHTICILVDIASLQRTPSRNLFRSKSKPKRYRTTSNIPEERDKSRCSSGVSAPLS